MVIRIILLIFHTVFFVWLLVFGAEIYTGEYYWVRIGFLITSAITVIGLFKDVSRLRKSGKDDRRN